MKSKDSVHARKEPRNLQSRGIVTRPHPTIKTNDQPTTTIKIAKSMTITKIEVIKTDDQPTTTIKIAQSMTNIIYKLKEKLVPT